MANIPRYPIRYKARLTVLSDVFTASITMKSASVTDLERTRRLIESHAPQVSIQGPDNIYIKEHSSPGSNVWTTP